MSMFGGISTVGELRQALEGYDEDTLVRAVVQPNYPMFASITQVQQFDKGQGTVDPETGEEEEGEEGYEQTFVALRISDNEDYGAPRDGEWW